MPLRGADLDNSEVAAWFVPTRAHLFAPRRLPSQCEAYSWNKHVPLEHRDAPQPVGLPRHIRAVVEAVRSVVPSSHARSGGPCGATER